DKGLDVSFAGVIGPVRDLLKRDGLVNKIGSDHFYFDVPSAVDALCGKPCGTPAPSYLLQANE
ncbi:MAG: sodium-independent anion transporter, partial [Bacteroidota bacterium]